MHNLIQTNPIRALLSSCRFSAFVFAAALLLSLPAAAQDAAPPLSSLEDQINEFVNSPQYRFAPDSTARARALLAASTMAEHRHDADARDQGARETAEALGNARRVASDFTSKYAATLKLETAAKEASGNIPDSGLIAAQESLSDLIRAFEQGRLNESAGLTGNVNKQFMAVIREKLPPLLQKTDTALLAASRNSAKRYAPVAYAQAEKWLADALAYSDGLSDRWPEHPALGLTLANRAYDLSEQVMQWRKKPDSYETLVIKSRDERLAVARTLGLPINAADPGADIDNALILEAIDRQRDAIRKQQQKFQQQIIAMETQYQLSLGEKTEELRNQLTQQQGAQMSEMKEAFRAKLERETFETRRQQKLGELFKKDEADILANVDGSILLRLTALQFKSGATGIDKKFYDLLSRVRMGLDLYSDRKVMIEGHTDNRGEPDVNQRLSLKRAETVRDFLIAAGMDGGRLKALGYGEVRPIASNDYERGMAMNRRIDIIIQAPK